MALKDVDPIYYDRTYWLGPANDDGKQAYQLFLSAMEDRERVGIGTVVMRNKQYLAAVRPLDGALAMSTMRFADEVVARSEVDGVPTRRSKPEAKALKLAVQIVDRWRGMEAGATTTPMPRSSASGSRRRTRARRSWRTRRRTNPRVVLDLMQALKASVKKKGKGGRKTARPKARKSGSPPKAPSRHGEPSARSRNWRTPVLSTHSWPNRATGAPTAATARRTELVGSRLGRAAAAIRAGLDDVDESRAGDVAEDPSDDVLGRRHLVEVDREAHTVRQRGLHDGLPAVAGLERVGVEVP